jgi:hypothetical protein
MSGGSDNHNHAECVALQHAVLCVDCEFVSTSRGDECPVCGGRSLLNLAGPIGGTLLDHKANRAHKERLVLFDLHITIDVQQMEGADLSVALERISNVVASKLARGLATLHINVEPTGSERSLKVAA